MLMLAFLAALAVCGLAVMQKRSPFAVIAWYCILARAAFLMAEEMAHGAGARLNRWAECVETARRF